MMQYMLINGINTILNRFTLFSNKVKCYESGDIIVKYANLIKIDLNDASQCVDVTINKVITRNTDNVVVEFIHYNYVNNYFIFKV